MTTTTPRALLEQAQKYLNAGCAICPTSSWHKAIRAELAKPTNAEHFDVDALKSELDLVRSQLAAEQRINSETLHVLESTEQKLDSLIKSAELAKPTKPVELVEPVAWVVLADVDGRMVPQYPLRSDKESAEKAALMFKKTKTAVMPLCLHPPTPAPATAPEPAWHDAPTEPGLWLCNDGDDNPYRRTTHRVTFPLNQLLVGENERWYGPIPQDTKAEGGAA